MDPLIKITQKGLRWFQSGHPWIFSSDISARQSNEAGIARVLGPKNEFLGLALYSPHSKIALRILTRKNEVIDQKWFRKKIEAAIQKREALEIPSNAKRLIFAEADGLPSLIVDTYADYLVVQTLSAGLEKFKTDIFKILESLLRPKGILERNDAPIRNKEKLPAIKQVVFGDVPKEIVIQETDLKFIVNLWEGQKTGGFLDQRNNRIDAGFKTFGKALDVFSYEGWFACHMAKKADSVLCIESSKQAAAKILENAKLNNLESKIQVEVVDAFDFLKNADRSGAHYDTINLDPPAFVKTASERLQGFAGYKEINLRAMKCLKPKGTLITSSCSYHFSAEEFEEMLDKAAHDAKVSLNLTLSAGASGDHPVFAKFPEGDYLKCYFLDVTG